MLEKPPQVDISPVEPTSSSDEPAPDESTDIVKTDRNGTPKICWLRAAQRRVKVKHLQRNPLPPAPPKPGLKKKRFSSPIIGQRSILNFIHDPTISLTGPPNLNPRPIISNSAANTTTSRSLTRAESPNFISGRKQKLVRR